MNTELRQRALDYRDIFEAARAEDVADGGVSLNGLAAAAQYAEALEDAALGLDGALMAYWHKALEVQSELEALGGGIEEEHWFGSYLQKFDAAQLRLVLAMAYAAAE